MPLCTVLFDYYNIKRVNNNLEVCIFYIVATLCCPAVMLIRSLPLSSVSVLALKLARKEQLVRKTKLQIIYLSLRVIISTSAAGYYSCVFPLRCGTETWYRIRRYELGQNDAESRCHIRWLRDTGQASSGFWLASIGIYSWTLRLDVVCQSTLMASDLLLQTDRWGHGFGLLPPRLRSLPLAYSFPSTYC